MASITTLNAAALAAVPRRPVRRFPGRRPLAKDRRACGRRPRRSGAPRRAPEDAGDGRRIGHDRAERLPCALQGGADRIVLDLAQGLLPEDADRRVRRVLGLLGWTAGSLIAALGRRGIRGEEHLIDDPDEGNGDRELAGLLEPQFQGPSRMLELAVHPLGHQLNVSIHVEMVHAQIAVTLQPLFDPRLIRAAINHEPLPWIRLIQPSSKLFLDLVEVLRGPLEAVHSEGLHSSLPIRTRHSMRLCLVIGDAVTEGDPGSGLQTHLLRGLIIRDEVAFPGPIRVRPGPFLLARK